jgi:hypothetical protein
MKDLLAIKQVKNQIAYRQKFLRDNPYLVSTGVNYHVKNAMQEIIDLKILLHKLRT